MKKIMLADDLVDTMEEVSCIMRGSCSILDFLSEHQESQSASESLGAVIAALGKGAEKLDTIAELFMKEGD